MSLNAESVLFGEGLVYVNATIAARANEILTKYKNGVTYIDSEWKGDTDLELGDVFFGKSLHEKTQFGTEFECQSNEIKFDSALRERTKGKALTKQG